MKKIFTLIAAAACVATISAANFELIHDGQVLSDGAKYDVGWEATESEVIPGVLTMYTVMRDAALYLKADPAEEMTVEVRSWSTKTQFCAFDGTCMQSNIPGQVMTKVGHTESEQPIDLRIDEINRNQNGFEYFTDNNPIDVKVYPTDDPDAAITVTVNMLPVAQSEIGSVEAVVSDGATFDYARYYDLQGRPVANPRQGSIYLRCQGRDVHKVVK